jgi:hypothetical protein
MINKPGLCRMSRFISVLGIWGKKDLGLGFISATLDYIAFKE